MFKRQQLTEPINKCLKRETFFAKISLKFPLTIKSIFSRLVFYIQLNTKIEGGKKKIFYPEKEPHSTILLRVKT